MSFGSALDAIGQRGAQRCGDHPLSAFFELHIEQGPILEAEGIDIGAVTGVQGIRWFEVTVTGQDAHTGATPMHLRKNALLGAARIVETGGGDRARARAGGCRNRGIDAGEAELAQRRARRGVPDHRHAPSRVARRWRRWRANSTRRWRPWANRSGFRLPSTKIWDQPPVIFDAQCVASVRKAAETSGFSVRDMVSGAGHDAAYVARVAPTAMIFVPCRGGISHNEAEFTSKEQCAAGAQVLLQAVLDYDRWLADQYATKGGVTP